ncbi:MAG: hypothetical protein HGA23_09550, partial [Bacteroidales bacterium]|nr:hypothetical protein [Bacteroidales bacterium]
MRRNLWFIVIIFLLPPYIYAYGSNEIPDLIKSKLDQLSINKDTRISGEKMHNIEYISNLYTKADFQPFWTKTEYINDAIRGLEASYEDGLIPNDYHLEEIIKLKQGIAAIKGESDFKAEKTADLDLLLTDGIIFYADHLLYGKIDPVTLVPTWNFGFAPIPDLNPFTFKQHIISERVTARLEELRPAMHLYDTLLTILARYREVAENGGWQTVLAGGKIEPGGRDVRIPAIRKRLLITGELSDPDSLSSTLYDKKLEDDVKAFQTSHGLDADGIIGVGTFRELNVPVEDRIASIRINLERVRWVAPSIPDSYIIVNIAAFWLLMVKDKQIVHSTAVVVGKPLNKTPLFRDKMKYI